MSAPRGRGGTRGGIRGGRGRVRGALTSARGRLSSSTPSAATVSGVAPATSPPACTPAATPIAASSRAVPSPISTTASMAKKTGIDYTDVITVLVGTEKRLFVVHVSKLQERSAFFKAASQGPWRESADKVINLPDIYADAFQVYLDSVYDREIRFEAMRDEIIMGASPGDLIEYSSACRYANDRCTLLLGHLWVTADYLGDVRMQDAAIDMLIMQDAKRNIAIPTELGIMCADGIMIDSKLTDWFVDHCNASSCAERLRKYGEAIPAQLLLKLWTTVLKYRGTVLPAAAPTMDDRCKYHQHKATEPCHSDRCGAC